MQRRKIGLLAGVGVLGIMACSILPGSLVGSISTQPTSMPVPPTVPVLPTMACITAETVACPTCPDCDLLYCPTPVSPTLESKGVPPTETVEPTYTPTAEVTATATATLQPVMPYQLQENNPIYQQYLFNPEKECNWMGVAGQVFDMDGNPVDNLVLSIVGSLNDIPVDLVGLTGTNNEYGPGGYEIVLSKKTFESTGDLKMSLFDLDGNPLSNPIAIDTFDDCQKNLIMVNFEQVSQ
jgi:hypothetical protein